MVISEGKWISLEYVQNYSEKASTFLVLESKSYRIDKTKAP